MTQPRHSPLGTDAVVEMPPQARCAAAGPSRCVQDDVDHDLFAVMFLRMFSGEVKLRFSTQKGFLDAIDHQFRLFNHQEMASIGHIFDRVVVIPACDEIRPN